MRYTYSSLYYIQGLLLSQDEELFSDTSRGARAILTPDPAPLCEHLDKAAVLPEMILTAQLQDGPEMEKKMEEKVRALRDERASTLKGGTFLYFEASGDVTVTTLGTQRDCGSFSVVLDDLPKEDVRKDWEPLAGMILAAVTIAIPKATRPRKVASAIVFFQANGKAVYGFNVQFGKGEGIISEHVAAGDLAVARSFASRIAADASLERITRLLNESMQPEEDRLSRFLSAFMAVEVFVNKNFCDYRDRFWDNLSAGVSAPVRDRYLARIHDVMKDKYKPLDKFVLIAAELDPGAADADIATFQRAQKLRNEFSHGEDIEETALKLDDIQGLLKKFLRLHIERA